MSLLPAMLAVLGLAGFAPTAHASTDTDWLPDSYSQAPAAVPDGAQETTPWWRSFDDPELDALVTRGLAANPDLGALDAVTLQQRALAAQALSPVMPSLSFDVAGQLAPTETRTFGLGFDFPDTGDDGPDTYGTGSAKLNAALGVDLWGRTLTSWKASRLDLMAAEGDRDAAALVLSANIGAAWLDVASARRQVEIVEQQLDLNQRLLEIVRLRYEGGSASALDLLQQQQSLASVEAQLPLSRALLRTTRQRLAVLVGQDPTADLPDGPARLPDLPESPALGQPADLLDSRPDLRAAASRVDGATARRSSAVRGLLPTLALSGSYGWQYYYEDELDSTDTWSVGASVSVPIFNGGSKHAVVRQAGAARTGAERQLESTLRTALMEVEAALVTETEQQNRVDAASVQLERARSSWELAVEQYTAGFADYLQVQSVLATLLSAELNQVQASRDLLGARLQLHQALGGAWTSDLDAIRADAPTGELR